MPQRFRKEIIRPREYTLPDGRKVDVTPERIAKWADTHTKMIEDGLKVPAPYYHEKNAVPVREVPSPSDGDAWRNGGFWDKLWVDEQTGSLWGECLAATEADAAAIGAKVKGVSLLAQPWHEKDRDWGDAITHIALTNKPVASGTGEFLALSLDGFAAMTGDVNDTDPNSPGSGGDGALLENCRRILASLGLELPADTDASNFLERLSSAGTAVLSYRRMQEGDPVTGAPKGSRIQPPAPVAMSHELELAVSLLAGAKVNDPKTGQPFTLDGLKAAAAARATQAHVSLSAEDQAMVNFARNNIRQSYETRLKALVSSGRLPQDVIDQQAMPLLNDLQVAFSADGKQIPNVLDALLAGWERIPANMALNGHSPHSYQQTRRQQPFALDVSGPGVRVEEMPTYDQDLRDPNRPMTPAEADAVIKEADQLVGA